MSREVTLASGAVGTMGQGSKAEPALPGPRGPGAPDPSGQRVGLGRPTPPFCPGVTFSSVKVR